VISEVSEVERRMTQATQSSFSDSRKPIRKHSEYPGHDESCSGVPGAKALPLLDSGVMSRFRSLRVARWQAPSAAVIASGFSVVPARRKSTDHSVPCSFARINRGSAQLRQCLAGSVDGLGLAGEAESQEASVVSRAGEE